MDTGICIGPTKSSHRVRIPNNMISPPQASCVGSEPCILHALMHLFNCLGCPCDELLTLLCPLEGVQGADVGSDSCGKGWTFNLIRVMMRS